jgi:hypothetical protein
MKQVLLQIKALLFHSGHIELPKDLGQEKFGLRPRHLPADAAPWAETEGVQALEMIVGECGVV